MKTDVEEITITKKETKEETSTDTGKKFILVLHNDDFNSFMHVIQSLNEVCDITEPDAEEIAMRVHTKGKSDVLYGSKSKLEPMKMQLVLRGLISDIESEDNR